MRWGSVKVWYRFAASVRNSVLSVMVVTAALPIGANVFLFSQRYRTAEDVVTSSVALSTMFGLVTLPIALLVAAHL